MNNREILATNVRSLMKLSGIRTQADLSAQTGISLTQVNNILRQEQSASVDIIERLANGLDCESWLLLTPTTFLKGFRSSDFLHMVYCYMRLRPNAQDAVWSITQELYEATRETHYL